MSTRIVALICGFIIFVVVLGIIIYISEIFILVFFVFLYKCVKELKKEEYKRDFFIKERRNLNLSVIVSSVVIVGLCVYFFIVDSSTLYFTAFVGLVMFSPHIKDYFVSLHHKKEN